MYIMLAHLMLFAALYNAVCLFDASFLVYFLFIVLILLCIIMYIMLAHLMLFAALYNAVCLFDASFLLLLIFANAFCFHALS